MTEKEGLEIAMMVWLGSVLMKLGTMQLTHGADKNGKRLMNHRVVLNLIILMHGVMAHMVILSIITAQVTIPKD